MSKRHIGSLNVTALIKAAQEKHSSFGKGKDSGNIYANIVMWENDELDEDGNKFSVQLNSKKEGREKGEKKVYLGRLKDAEEFKRKKQEEVEDATEGEVIMPTNPLDNLPF